MADINQLRAELLKGLAQPTRLKIIELLRDGEKCVCEIFPAINEEQSNTSRHLNMMQTSGILSRRKDGLKIYYAIKHPQVLEVITLVTALIQQETEGRHRLLAAA